MRLFTIMVKKMKVNLLESCILIGIIAFSRGARFAKSLKVYVPHRPQLTIVPRSRFLNCERIVLIVLRGRSVIAMCIVHFDDVYKNKMHQDPRLF
jgi:hypothetical protein